MSKNKDWNELQPHTKHLSSYPVIRDPAKVIELYNQWKNHGDRRAYDRLVYSNTKLVISIAKKFGSWSGVSLSDLIQEGFLGLIRALENWDFNRSKLHTYAS